MRLLRSRVDAFLVAMNVHDVTLYASPRFMLLYSGAWLNLLIVQKRVAVFLRRVKRQVNQAIFSCYKR